MRRDEFAVDEMLVTRLQPDVIVRLRRGRVFPLFAEGKSPLARRYRHAVAV
jgi:hypothetical protein